VDTPFFTGTNAIGQFKLNGVPPGEYRVTVWHEVVSKLSKDAGPTGVTVTGKGDPSLEYRVRPPNAAND
jgi:hypothetical protein